MTDRKISDLTNITGANLADDDEFVVVDTSADETKAITYGELKKFNGDVSFDGDTGTTPKFFWDASAESLGIGTTSPDSASSIEIAGTLGNMRLKDSGAEIHFTRNSNSDIFANGGTSSSLNVGGRSNFRVYTGDTLTERMRIDSSGDLLVGTSIRVGLAGTSGLRRGGTGQLLLGSDNGGLFHQVLSQYYTVTTSGGSTSDATLKKNLTPLTGALEKVCNLRGVNFEFKAAQKSDPDNGVQLGVIAQEVEAQYPEAVVTNSDGIKSVRYDKLVAPLIEAIKEQKAIIDALETRITALEG